MRRIRRGRTPGRRSRMDKGGGGEGAGESRQWLLSSRKHLFLDLPVSVRSFFGLMCCNPSPALFTAVTAKE